MCLRFRRPAHRCRRLVAGLRLPLPPLHRFVSLWDMSLKLRLSAACAGGLPLLRLRTWRDFFLQVSSLSLPLLRLRGVQRLHLDVERVLLLLAQMPGGAVALAAAKASAFYDQQATAAKARQQAHGNTSPGNPKTLMARVPEPVGTTRDVVGKAFGVSGRMVEYAIRVLGSAVTEVVQAVEHAHDIKLEALRLLGTMLKSTPRHKPAIRQGSKSEPRDSHPTLSDLGLDKKTSMLKATKRNTGERGQFKPKTGSSNMEEAVLTIPELGLDHNTSMLKATTRNTGAKGIGTSVVPKENRTPPTLAELGLDKNTSLLARRVASLSQEQFQDVQAVTARWPWLLPAEVLHRFYISQRPPQRTS